VLEEFLCRLLVACAPDNRPRLHLLEHGDATQVLSLSSSDEEDDEEEVEEEDDNKGSTS